MTIETTTVTRCALAERIMSALAKDNRGIATDEGSGELYLVEREAGSSIESNGGPISIFVCRVVGVVEDIEKFGRELGALSATERLEESTIKDTHPSEENM